MKEKLRSFWAKSKETVVYVGVYILASMGIVGVSLIGFSLLTKKRSEYGDIPTFVPDSGYDDELDALAESYGGWRKGSLLPYITKEGAKRFIEERGDVYQIDTLDENSSLLYIIRDVNDET